MKSEEELIASITNFEIEDVFSTPFNRKSQYYFP